VARREIGQLGTAVIHRAGALAADDRAFRRLGGDVFEGPIVVGRRLLVGDLRCDHRAAFSADFLAIAERRGVSFG
jgi:hypothetical protein